MHITLDTACCLSHCWCSRCCSVLLKLHAHRSCTALFLLLLYVCMLYAYGLPFVVGLPLLLRAPLFYMCVFFLPFVFEPRSVSGITLLFLCLYLFRFDFFSFYTYRVPAQSEQIIIYAYYSGYCLLFVVLMVLPLLQHAVYCG